MITHEEMRRKYVLIPQEMKERGDRLEALLVDIKRLLEIIAARQLVQIQLVEDEHPNPAHTEAAQAAMKMGAQH